MAPSLAMLSMLVAALVVVYVESRSVPDNLRIPVRAVQVLPSRDKRQAYQMVYPPRTLMFTSFYRPARQSETQGSPEAQASGVYAQGNAVGGGAFFQQPQPQLPQVLSEQEAPEPIDEPEVAISEAVAAPQHPSAAADGEVEEEEEQEVEQPEKVDLVQPETDDKAFTEKPASKKPKSQAEPSRKSGPKKTKKIPIAPPAEDDEEYDDDEEIEAADEPFRPPNKSRKNKPYSLNNYFPVVFSIPAGALSRKSGPGSAGDVPGLITAIANSYSTSKGGVASSVATAYGGMPTKKRRTSQAAAAQ